MILVFIIKLIWKNLKIIFFLVLSLRKYYRNTTRNVGFIFKILNKNFFIFIITLCIYIIDKMIISYQIITYTH